MQPPALPEDEADRLQALHATEILDAEREPPFEALVALGARICRKPMAAISLQDMALGSFGALGVQPGSLSPLQRQALEVLADQAMLQLESRCALQHARPRLTKHVAQVGQPAQRTPEAFRMPPPLVEARKNPPSGRPHDAPDVLACMGEGPLQSSAVLGLQAPQVLIVNGMSDFQTRDDRAGAAQDHPNGDLSMDEHLRYAVHSPLKAFADLRVAMEPLASMMPYLSLEPGLNRAEFDGYDIWSCLASYTANHALKCALWLPLSAGLQEFWSDMFPPNVTNPQLAIREIEGIVPLVTRLHQVLEDEHGALKMQGASVEDLANAQAKLSQFIEAVAVLPALLQMKIDGQMAAIAQQQGSEASKGQGWTEKTFGSNGKGRSLLQ